jgi:ketosteroid isomerase-like protein
MFTSTRGELMATQTVPLSREQLAAIPDTYFKAVDAQDVDAIMSHFADDATLTVQTDHAVFTGADEIRRMFIDFCGNSVSIFHEIKNIVVEPEAGKVATEQSYIGELVDGTRNDMHNCNFFDINADGQFTRVIIWMSGTNPLK